MSSTSSEEEEEEEREAGRLAGNDPPTADHYLSHTTSREKRSEYFLKSNY